MQQNHFVAPAAHLVEDLRRIKERRDKQDYMRPYAPQRLIDAISGQADRLLPGHCLAKCVAPERVLAYFEHGAVVEQQAIIEVVRVHVLAERAERFYPARMHVSDGKARARMPD